MFWDVFREYRIRKMLVYNSLKLGTLCKSYQAEVFKNFVQKAIHNPVVGKRRKA